MVKKVVLITGANRGLGYEFARQLSLSPVPPVATLTESTDSFAIVALSRSLPADDLDALQAGIAKVNADTNNTPRELHILKCDVSNDDEIAQVKQFVIENLGGRIDLFICNAGVIDSESTPGFTVAGITSNQDQDVARIIHTNAISPVVLTNIFAPLLQAAADSLMSDDEKKNFTPHEFDSTVNAGVDVLGLGSKEKMKQYAQCVYISSTLASIENADTTMTPTYRASKAALSMYVKTLAYQYPAINMLLLSPGWVQTRMGSHGGTRNPPLTPEQSITAMNALMNQYRSRQDSAHAIIDYDGTIVPW